jgi:hypothetical protein
MINMCSDIPLIYLYNERNELLGYVEIGRPIDYQETRFRMNSDDQTDGSLIDPESKLRSIRHLEYVSSRRDNQSQAIALQRPRASKMNRWMNFLRTKTTSDITKNPKTLDLNPVSCDENSMSIRYIGGKRMVVVAPRRVTVKRTALV